ncbi:MAG: hypothetical protein ACOZQL_19530 [Myxococcota bacterium]
MGAELVGAVLSSVVIWLLGRWWAKHDREFSGSELRHSSVFFWLGAVIAVPASAAAVSLALDRDWSSAGLAVGLSLLGFYAVWEVLFVCFSFSDDAFRWRTLRAGRGQAPWAELEKVGWEKRNRLLTLQFRERLPVRVSRFLLARAAHASIEPAARRLLALCADGKRPDNWDEL